MQRFTKVFFTLFIIFSFALSSIYMMLGTSTSSPSGRYGSLSFRQTQDGSVLLNTPRGPTTVWRLPDQVAYLYSPQRQTLLAGADSLTITRPSTADSLVHTIVYLMKTGLEKMGKQVTVGFTDQAPRANCTTQSTPTILIQQGGNDTIQQQDTCIILSYTTNSTLLDESAVVFYEALRAYS